MVKHRDGGHSKVYTVFIDYPAPETKYIFKFNLDNSKETTKYELDKFNSVWELVEPDDCSNFFIKPPKVEIENNPGLFIFDQVGSQYSEITISEMTSLNSLYWLYNVLVRGIYSKFSETDGIPLGMKNIYKNLFNGMKCMNDKGIYHGDIKSGNFIYIKEDKQLMPKFIDMGDIKLKDKIVATAHTTWDFEENMTVPFISIFYSQFKGVAYRNSEGISDDDTVQLENDGISDDDTVQLENDGISDDDTVQLENDEDTNKKISYILLTNDRYAFTLMLIGNFLGSSNWANDWLKKETNDESSIFKGQFPQSHHALTIPEVFLELNFWTKFTGELKNISFLENDPSIKLSEDLSGLQSTTKTLRAEQDKLSKRKLKLDQQPREDSGADQDQVLGLAEALVEYGTDFTEYGNKVSDYKRKASEYKREVSEVKHKMVYNIFQKIFEGLDTVKDLTTIDEIYERCVIWNTLNWNHLTPFKDPLPVMGEPVQPEEPQGEVQPEELLDDALAIQH